MNKIFTIVKADGSLCEAVFIDDLTASISQLNNAINQVRFTHSNATLVDDANKFVIIKKNSTYIQLIMIENDKRTCNKNIDLLVLR